VCRRCASTWRRRWSLSAGRCRDWAVFFTITGSENLTNCWSHGNGKACPRCGKRPPAEVISEVNGTFYEGIRRAGNGQTLIVWDWGWHDDWVESIIAQLPREARFMSVSEWGMPIRRGGVATTVGEYSISTIGPGERARHYWGAARARGMRTLAKVQCGNTWELSAVPYIPAVANVARHAANLRGLGVNGLMLGWTLGGYPSPNLEVVAEIGFAPAEGDAADVESAMLRVAQRRFGRELAPQVVSAWQEYSAAFSEFPFHGSLVYNAPMQVGPANPLWAEPTGYQATMVGFPYDDLDGWRAVYPPEIFIGQFEKLAAGFEQAHESLAAALQTHRSTLLAEQRTAVAAGVECGRSCRYSLPQHCQPGPLHPGPPPTEGSKLPGPCAIGPCGTGAAAAGGDGLSTAVARYSKPRLAHWIRGVQRVFLRAAGLGGEGHQLPGPANAPGDLIAWPFLSLVVLQ
jgi:hypothetical protein